MPWTERQRRLLAELGLPTWLAPGVPPAPVGVALPAPAPAAAPAPRAPAPAARSTERPAVPAVPRPTSAAVPAAVPAPTGAPASAPPRPGPIPREGIDQLDWPALRAAVESCTACGLCSGRTQTVFGVGHPEADWMIVGEAPGEHEDRQGEPFVGKSGQLLDNMLRALGLGRADGPPQRQVYIANTLKCRPPGNRNPTPEELARCEPFLVRQIALVRPRIILAMGRFAVQSLLRSSEPIGRLRGQRHHYQGVPLVVTYHPAYLLRNPQDKARAWDDLCLAAEVAEEAGAVAMPTPPTA